MPENNIDTRTEIIEAAREQFILHGYEGARLQKIADHIGATKAMIHYYFNTKKELFEHVYLQSLHTIFGELPETLEKDVPLFKKIEELIEASLEIARNHPRLLSFVITESNRKSDWLKPLIREQQVLKLQAFDGELNRAASNYQIASVDAYTLLMQIFSLCYYPVLSSPLNHALFEDAENAPEPDPAARKGVVLDTILNWLTA